MKASGLQSLLNRILLVSTKRILILTVGVQFAIAVILLICCIYPSFKKTESLNTDVRAALESRNESLVVSALERSADEGQRIIRSAERSLLAIAQELPNNSIVKKLDQFPPEEKDYKPGGQYFDLLQNNPYYETPVTFELPQTIIRNNTDKTYFSRSWKQFLSITSRHFEQNPGIKWIYMGTPYGSFMVYPASPAIPTN